MVRTWPCSCTPVRWCTSAKRPSWACDMGILDGVERDIDGVTQVEVIMAPVGDMMVIEVPKRYSCPGHSMDAIGNGVHRVVREHAARDVAMAHGNTIDVAREVQCQIRHVQHVVRAAIGLLQECRPLSPQYSLHRLYGKAVLSGGPGVWVVNTQRWRTASTSSSVTAYHPPSPVCSFNDARVSSAACPSFM